MRLLGVLPKNIASLVESGLPIYTNDGIRIIERSLERSPVLRDHVRTETYCGGITKHILPVIPPRGYAFPKCTSGMFDSDSFLKEISASMFIINEVDLFFKNNGVNISIENMLEHKAIESIPSIQKACHENSTPDENISPNERRELTRLRNERDKFPEILRQATASALYAGIMCTKRKVTRADLDKGIAMVGLQPLGIDIKNQVWKALPPVIQSMGRTEDVPEPRICKSIRDARSRESELSNPTTGEISTNGKDDES